MWNFRHTFLRQRQPNSRMFRVLSRAYFLINTDVERRGGNLWGAGKVWESVWGEVRGVGESVLGCKGRHGNGCREMRKGLGGGVGRNVGKCRRRYGKVCWGLGESVWGSSYLPHTLPLTSLLHPNTLPYTSTPISTLTLHPNTFSHISNSVTKVSCDECQCTICNSETKVARDDRIRLFDPRM